MILEPLSRPPDDRFLISLRRKRTSDNLRSLRSSPNKSVARSQCLESLLLSLCPRGDPPPGR